MDDSPTSGMEDGICEEGALRSVMKERKKEEKKKERKINTSGTHAPVTLRLPPNYPVGQGVLNIFLNVFYSSSKHETRSMIHILTSND